MTAGYWTIPDVAGIKTPYSILMEQAQALRDGTNGLLVGRVERSTVGDRFENSLEIVVPSLNSYVFQVLSVIHNVNLYPVRMFLPWSNNSGYELLNESELEQDLKKTLSSPQIQKVITGLLAQVSGN